MTREEHLIIDGFKKLCDPGPMTCTADVLSVNEIASTCVVKTAAGQELEDVRLKALKNSSDGLLIVPKIGSTVLLLSVGKPDWFVVAVTQVDKVMLTAAVKVEINGGDNAGLVKVKELTQQLVTLQKDINALKQILQVTWTPVANDGGAALKTKAASWAAQKLQETQQGDIENTKVKH